MSESLSSKAYRMANRIRVIVMGCESKDVMSCEFGNEFASRIEKFILEELEKIKAAE